MILGFAMSDIPIVSDKESERSRIMTWPRVLRNLGAGAPGRQAYVATMRERYGGVAALNTAYATGFGS